VDEKDGVVLTTSSRTLGVVGMADSIEEAEAICEAGLAHVQGEIFVRPTSERECWSAGGVEHIARSGAEQPFHNSGNLPHAEPGAHRPEDTGLPGGEGYRQGDRHQVSRALIGCRADVVHGMHKGIDGEAALAEP
jgi:hypothetical protein